LKLTGVDSEYVNTESSVKRMKRSSINTKVGNTLWSESRLFLILTISGNNNLAKPKHKSNKTLKND